MTRRTILQSTLALLSRGEAAGAPESMVHIPAGSFVMGAARAEVSEGGRASRADTRHTVRLSDYYIAKYLTTNAQYKLFCDSAGAQYRPGGLRRGGGGGSYWDHPAFDWKEKANHPVLWVGYEQAAAYCKWVSGNTGSKVMLPSEAQWERAARGATQTGDEREFPWGNTTSAGDYQTRLNFNVHCAMKNGVSKTVDGRSYPHWPFVVETRGDSAFASNFRAVVYGEEGGDEVKAVWSGVMDRGGETTAVGTYPAGPEGCFDMAGNAFEWTRDFYTVSAYMKLAEKMADPCVEDPSIVTENDRKSGSDGGRGGGGTPTKVLRGGSWYANESSCRTHRRVETRIAGRGGYHSVGFRVVMSA